MSALETSVLPIFAAGDHARQPHLEDDDADAAGERPRQDDFPPHRERHPGDDPDEEREQNEARDDQQPQLLRPAKASDLHRVPEIGC